MNEGEKISFAVGIKALFQNKYWIIFTIVYTLIMLYASIYGGSVLYYAQYVLGNAEHQATIQNALMITQLVFLMGSFVFIKKFGKAKTFNIGVIIMLAGFAGQALLGDTAMIQIVFSAVKGIGLGIASGVTMGCIADTVEYGEWKTGIRTEGMACAAMTFAAKIGSGVGTAMVGWLLSFGKFDAKAATQIPSAILAIKGCYVYFPALFCLIMIFLMAFYDLDKRYDGIIADLEERRANK
ncbi:MAG: MFS transporter [Eubacteriales bacterium]|nr:MFS transporter [Eubacteriales bacterium]